MSNSLRIVLRGISLGGYLDRYMLSVFPLGKALDAFLVSRIGSFFF
jgi:hypothetical protein